MIKCSNFSKPSNTVCLGLSDAEVLQFYPYFQKFPRLLNTHSLFYILCCSCKVKNNLCHHLVTSFYTHFFLYSRNNVGFPSSSDSKASACNVGELALIPGSGSSLEKKMATHSSILA